MDRIPKILEFYFVRRGQLWAVGLKKYRLTPSKLVYPHLPVMFTLIVTRRVIWIQRGASIL